ncbi:MAG: hypothetical protein Q4G63_11440 [Bacteroidia bacterium]|nr:hypothetical protein [Bacteroidia bacterium]
MKAIYKLFCFSIFITGVATFISCDNEKQSLPQNSTKEDVIKHNLKGRVAHKESNELEDAIIKESSTRTTGLKYPDFYGGIYLDENFDINIVVKDSNIDYYKKIIEGIVKSTPYHIHKGEFSLNSLNKVQDKITDVLSNNPPPKHIRENISVIGYSIRLNRVVVELKDTTEAKINDFKKSVMDSPAIVFKENLENIEDLANINPGSGIVPAGTPGCSVGYRARNTSGQNGFVSSGHAFTRVDQTAIINNVVVGRCQRTQVKNRLDAAFIVITNSSYTPTMQVDVVGQPLTNVAYIIREGAPASLKGVESNFTSGVTIMNASIGGYGSNGEFISDLIRVGPAATKHGDSGGIAYDNYSILGVIKGVNSGNTFVVKASNINSTFGLTIY